MVQALVLLLATAFLPRALAGAQGAVKLDNYTFDKMLTVPGLTVLAKIDKSYAYGEKEDAFKELCKLAYPVRNFIIGEIPVQEYGDKENDDIREKLEVKADEFPAFFLFKGSYEARTKFEGFPDPLAKKPASWDEDEDGAWEAPMRSEVTVENLALWLRRSGVKMPAVGTIPEMDEVVVRFMTEGQKDSDVEQVKALAAGDYQNDKKAPIYVRTMEKVKAKGVEYVPTELARIKKIMDGKITPEKKADLAEKVKILSVFAETA